MCYVVVFTVVYILLMPFNTLEQDRRNRIGDSSLSPLELGLSSSPISDVPASQLASLRLSYIFFDVPDTPLRSSRMV